MWVRLRGWGVVDWVDYRGKGGWAIFGACTLGGVYVFFWLFNMMSYTP